MGGIFGGLVKKVPQLQPNTGQPQPGGIGGALVSGAGQPQNPGMTGIGAAVSAGMQAGQAASGGMGGAASAATGGICPTCGQPMPAGMGTGQMQPAVQPQTQMVAPGFGNGMTLNGGQPPSSSYANS